MNEKSSMNKILYGAVFALLIGIVLLVSFKPKEKVKKPVKESAQPVVVLCVEKMDHQEVISLPALLEATFDATLAAEKPGRVVRILVDRGDGVKKDQLLLQIDDRTERAMLKRAEIVLSDAKKAFNRFERLKKEGAVAESEYDRVDKENIVAAARLDEMKVVIEKCQVRSPEKGVINDRFIEEGEYVLPGTPLFQVVDDSEIKVVLQIPEKDIFSIKRGEKMTFKIQSIKDRTFEGTVSFVAVQADAQNNAFRAELRVSNTDHQLRPGMIARVLFKRGMRKKMVSLPVSAVLPSKGDHIVFLVKEGRAVRRKVKIARLSLTQALIYEGLHRGDVVVVEGNRTISDGQRIKIIDREVKK